MLLEYLEDPDAQVATRVLLLYAVMPDEAGALRSAIERLSRGKPGGELRVDALPGVVALDGSSLAATVDDADLGMEPAAGADRQFRCALTSAGWQRVCGLLEPFLRSDCQGSRIPRKRVRSSGPSPTTEAVSDSNDGTLASGGLFADQKNGANPDRTRDLLLAKATGHLTGWLPLRVDARFRGRYRAR
jgi:hypothetical protein